MDDLIERADLSVPERRQLRELLASGQIVVAGEAVDPQTKKTVETLKVRP